jgi:hypothetical protein
VAEWKMSDGTLDRTTALANPGLGVWDETYGITRIGTSWYLQVVLGGLQYLIQSNRSSGAFTASSNLAAYFFTGSYTGVLTDGTYLYVPGRVTDSKHLCIVSLTSAMAYVTTTNLTMPTAPPGSIDVYQYSPGPFVNIGDGNGTCFFLGLFWSIAGGPYSPQQVYQFSSTGALIANTDWTVADGTSYGTRGLLWDGTYFYQVIGSLLYQFTNWMWLATPGTHWVAYAWYDDAGTVHESAVGPANGMAMLKRRQLTVSNLPIPTGGADDPNKVRIYMAAATSVPAPGAFKLQVSDALTSRVLTTYNAAGAADGAGTPFANGTGARIVPAAQGWELRGDGRMIIQGFAAFPTSPTTQQTFFRSDFSAWFYWDGFRWVSETLYQLNAYAFGFTASGTFWAGFTVPLLGTDIFLVDVLGGTRVVGTNNGSNYWTCNTYKVSGGGTTPNVAAFSTSADTAGQYGVPHRTAIGALMTQGTYPSVLVDLTKTGTPGAIDIDYTFRYRIVTT